MRFLADAMLGKLSKWLRILGYDTLYDSDTDDDALISTARTEGRMVLTRDTRLVSRLAPGEYLFIRDNKTTRQLAQTVEELSLDTWGENIFTRCTACNAPLEDAPRESVAGDVPEYTYHAAKGFLRCPSCGRVYWEGTHKNRIRARLEALFGEGEPGR